MGTKIEELLSKEISKMAQQLNTDAYDKVERLINVPLEQRLFEARSKMFGEIVVKSQKKDLDGI